MILQSKAQSSRREEKRGVTKADAQKIKVGVSPCAQEGQGETNKNTIDSKEQEQGAGRLGIR
jgi:hypothetical protein